MLRNLLDWTSASLKSGDLVLSAGAWSAGSMPRHH
jgi:hypothetical protein